MPKSFKDFYPDSASKIWLIVARVCMNTWTWTHLFKVLVTTSEAYDSLCVVGELKSQDRAIWTSFISFSRSILIWLTIENKLSTDFQSKNMDTPSFLDAPTWLSWGNYLLPLFELSFYRCTLGPLILPFWQETLYKFFHSYG